MEKLPNEILFHILSYLSLKDRSEKRIVCKAWNEMIPQLPIWIDEKHKNELLEPFVSLGTMIHFSEEIIKIYFDECIYDVDILDENQEILFVLQLSDTEDIIEFTNLNFENFYIHQKNIEELRNQESSLDILVGIFIYLIKTFPNCHIKIGNSIESTDYIKSRIKQNVLDYLLNNLKELEKKYPIFNDVSNFSVLTHYLDVINEYKNELCSHIPMYILKNDKLLKDFIICNIDLK